MPNLIIFAPLFEMAFGITSLICVIACGPMIKIISTFRFMQICILLHKIF